MTDSIEISEIKEWKLDTKASQNIDTRFLDYVRFLARHTAENDMKKLSQQDSNNTIH